MINFTPEELLQRLKDKKKHEPEHIGNIVQRIIEKLFDQN